jgi:hypothetical protein
MVRSNDFAGSRNRVDSVLTTSRTGRFSAMAAVLALAAGALLVPSQARAGCDNHAFIGASKGALADFSKNPGHPLADPTGKRPCSGPNCSRGSEPGPLVPVFLSPSTGDQWLWVKPLQVTPDLRPAGFLCELAAENPRRRCDPIDPPPRLHTSDTL